MLGPQIYPQEGSARSFDSSTGLPYPELTAFPERAPKAWETAYQEFQLGYGSTNARS